MQPSEGDPDEPPAARPARPRSPGSGGGRGDLDAAKATANPLIQIVIGHGLVPTYSKDQLENVARCLIGVATIRNKNAGHGAGSKPRDVPEHYAAYALHLAAANIVFLVECHNAMPK